MCRHSAERVNSHWICWVGCKREKNRENRKKIDRQTEKRDKRKKEEMPRRGGRREGERNRSVVTKALKLPGDGGGHGKLRHQS